ncbi:MAG: rod-binding protein [Dongiaceae bacterium]
MDPVAAAAPAAAAATASPAVDRDSAAYKAAQEFEAVFLAQMVAQMHAGIEAGGPFGGGFAEETYRSLMYQEIGRQMALSGGVGIAAAVYDEMVKLQGGSE